MTHKTKHTPGPWHYDWTSKTNGYITGFHVGRQIAPMDEMGCIEHLITIPNDRPTEEEAEANARLIAAAPELLEALEELQGYELPVSQACLDRINAAIAKARGES